MLIVPVEEPTFFFEIITAAHLLPIFIFFEGEGLSSMTTTISFSYTPSTLPLTFSSSSKAQKNKLSS